MSDIPRWLELQAEIDYWYFVLGQMLKEEKALSPLTKVIDYTTGYEQERIKDVNAVIEKIRSLRAEYDQLQKTASEPQPVRSDDNAVSTADFPISDVARRTVARVLRREVVKRRRRDR